MTKEGWSKTASGAKTINGDGLDWKLSEAARFLPQSTIAYDFEEIERVADMGIELWIDDQMSKPYSLYHPLVTEVLEDFNAHQVSVGKAIYPRPYAATQRTAWWRMNMTERDFLRDKITYAWSEILVISWIVKLQLEYIKPIGHSNIIDIVYGISAVLHLRI